MRSLERSPAYQAAGHEDLSYAIAAIGRWAHRRAHHVFADLGTAALPFQHRRLAARLGQKLVATHCWLPSPLGFEGLARFVPIRTGFFETVGEEGARLLFEDSSQAMSVSAFYIVPPGFAEEWRQAGRERWVSTFSAWAERRPEAICFLADDDNLGYVLSFGDLVQTADKEAIRSILSQVHPAW